jgi:hypothetical protein
MRTISGAVFALACACVSCGSSSGGSTSNGGGGGSSTPSTPHGRFVMEIGSQTYQYDCDAQPGELSLGTSIKTVGCNWPSNNPILEIDFEVDSQIDDRVAIEDQTFDLSTASPDQIEIVAGESDASGNGDSIYSSWAYPDPNVDGPVMITAPGTSGSVTVRSYDPTTGHLDITLANVVIPLATNLPATYPNSPASVVIQSAEIVR